VEFTGEAAESAGIVHERSTKARPRFEDSADKDGVVPRIVETVTAAVELSDRPFDQWDGSVRAQRHTAEPIHTMACELLGNPSLAGVRGRRTPRQ